MFDPDAKDFIQFEKRLKLYFKTNKSDDGLYKVIYVLDPSICAYLKNLLTPVYFTKAS